MNRAIQDVENDSYDLRAPESTWVCCDLFPALVLRIYEVKGLTLSGGVLVHRATMEQTQFQFECGFLADHTRFIAPCYSKPF